MTIQELEQAIALYGKDIYSFCLHLTGSRVLADELYQDTFLKATERAGKLKTDGNLKSYFLSIAVRLWKNQRRKSAWRQRIAPVQELHEETESGGIFADEDMLDLYLKEEQRQMVRKAVSGLEEKYRIPVLLCYMERMSVKETAAVMGIPQGTVKSRLNTARRYLASELEEYIRE